MVYQYHLITGVAHGGQCASACVEVWASGVTKTVPTDGRVGIHHATALNDAQASAATYYSASVYAHLGAPANVLSAVENTPNDDIHWLTQDELVAWRATIIP
jgi:hypothetical protein